MALFLCQFSDTLHGIKCEESVIGVTQANPSERRVKGSSTSIKAISILAAKTIKHHR